MNAVNWSFWFFSMLIPMASIVFVGAALIVWIVMSQRTKRQAIAAGMDATAYQGLGPRWLALRIGVFLCCLGLAFCLITLLKVPEDSGLAWGLLMLGCGGALVLNHLLIKRLSSAQP